MKKNLYSDNKSKKALVITFLNHNYVSGGTEAYSRLLFPILHELKFEIDEYSILKTLLPQKMVPQLNYVNILKPKFQIITGDNLSFFNLFYVLDNNRKALLTQAKEIAKIINKYDLVINYLVAPHNVNYQINKLQKKNFIWVQHLSADKIFKNKLLKCLKPLLSMFKMSLPNDGITNVCYTNEDISDIKKACPKKFKHSLFYDISLPYRFTSNFLSCEKIKQKFLQPIGITCRLVPQKRVDFANDIAKYLNQKIMHFGPIHGDVKRKYKHINFCGEYVNDEISKIQKYISLQLILSDFEGFCFSAVEAICNGTPIVIRDTFLSARYLVSRDNGILIPRKMKPKAVAKIINELLSNPEKYQKMCENAMAFSQEFKYEKFVEKWKNVIVNIIADNKK